jgi:IS5 family transposase
VQDILRHYAPAPDVAFRPAYPGLLLFKVGLWHGGLSDEAVESKANINLHVLCFLGLALEDNVPDHSVLAISSTPSSTVKA